MTAHQVLCHFISPLQKQQPCMLQPIQQCIHLQVELHITRVPSVLPHTKTHTQIVDNQLGLYMGCLVYSQKELRCMQGAFHGRTMGAMALTSSKTFYKTGFAPLMPQTFTAPYPYCLHCKARQAAPDGKDWYKVIHSSQSGIAFRQ